MDIFITKHLSTIEWCKLTSLRTSSRCHFCSWGKKVFEMEIKMAIQGLRFLPLNHWTQLTELKNWSQVKLIRLLMLSCQIQFLNWDWEYYAGIKYQQTCRARANHRLVRQCLHFFRPIKTLFKLRLFLSTTEKIKQKKKQLEGFRNSEEFGKIWFFSLKM